MPNFRLPKYKESEKKYSFSFVSSFLVLLFFSSDSKRWERYQIYNTNFQLLFQPEEVFSIIWETKWQKIFHLQMATKFIFEIWKILVLSDVEKRSQNSFYSCLICRESFFIFQMWNFFSICKWQKFYNFGSHISEKWSSDLRNIFHFAMNFNVI